MLATEIQVLEFAVAEERPKNLFCFGGDLPRLAWAFAHGVCCRNRACCQARHVTAGPNRKRGTIDASVSHAAQSFEKYLPKRLYREFFGNAGMASVSFLNSASYSLADARFMLWNGIDF